VSVAAADDNEWMREDMEWWGSQVPAEYLVLKKNRLLGRWEKTHKNKFQVFPPVQSSSTDGT